MIYLDTESIGFFGPTMLIQYSEGRDSPVVLHNVFNTPVQSTLNLIECIINDTVCGFNLVHDWFHISKTYNVLKCLPHNVAPDPLDYADVESTAEAHDRYCLKPKGALDLLLVGKKSKFQSVMKHKDITIRRVPRACAEQLVLELIENIKISDIHFNKSKSGYRWQVIDLEKNGRRELTPDMIENGIKADPVFINIRLRFAPDGSLKSIMRSLGYEIEMLSDLDKMDGLPSLKQIDCGWYPCNSKWTTVFRQYDYAWLHNTKRLEYARNDVVWLKILEKELGYPPVDDTDSILACSVGAMYWKGFSIDIPTVRKRYEHTKSIIQECPVNVSAPRQVKAWLSDVASPMERILLKDTRSETLRTIAEEWVNSNVALATRCKQVIDARRAKNETQMLARLLIAGRAYFLNKIIGTKSNRMSGGGESYIKSNGSINPQGIRKGDATRSCFTLALAPLVLCGGDFDGFEVSIAEAVYKDMGLRNDLLSGKKIHALFGSAMYNMSYEDIMETVDINKDDDRGYYSRAKTGFFGTLYGAQEEKLASALRITVQEARAGLQRFFIRYPGIKKAQQRIIDDMACLYQSEMGGKVEWKEPKTYAESMFGFRRCFELEYSVIRALFSMACNPSEALLEISNESSRVVRRDRSQTTAGATISSLYATCFSLSSGIVRAAINHEIQSPGGEITKELQAEIWGVQSSGIGAWQVMPLNIHDELECPCDPSVIATVTDIVNNRIKELRDRIPLVKMEWKTNLKNWGEK